MSERTKLVSNSTFAGAASAREELAAAALTHKPASEAEEALRCAEGNVKLAVLLLHGCDLETAALLDETCGQFRPAVERVKRIRAAE